MNEDGSGLVRPHFAANKEMESKRSLLYTVSQPQMGISTDDICAEIIRRDSTLFKWELKMALAAKGAMQPG
jgi:hypothetical protein